MLGWNPGNDRELLSEAELINLFSLDRVQKGGAIFDDVKLLWLNKEYIKRLPEEDWKEEILKRLPEELLESDSFESRKDKVLPLIWERISTFGEVDEMAKSGDLGFFFIAPELKKEMIFAPEKLRKGKEVTDQSTGDLLKHVNELLETIAHTDFTKEKVKEIVFPYADEQGRGLVLWPMRVALSGKEKSPDPFELSDILGKRETMARIETAIKTLI